VRVSEIMDLEKDSDWIIRLQQLLLSYQRLIAHCFWCEQLRA